MADSPQSSSSDLSPMDSFPPDFYHLVPPEISPPDYPSSDPSVLEFIESSRNYLASLPFKPSESKFCPLPCSRYKTSIDIIREENPEEYKIIIDICKLALEQYKSEELYDFESVPVGEEVDVTAVGCMQYTLKFRAMKVDGHVEMFEVTGQFTGGGNLIITECTLLK
nr:hypothetical protein Iba_chr13cCG0890 [Ipomoea batatas]GME15956.1 hypothetical protein Iba_scaffold16883CG0670 [Ipomoea batatas]